MAAHSGCNFGHHVFVWCILFVQYTASFTPLKEGETYQEIVDEVVRKRAVSGTGKKSVDEIQQTIRKKWSAYTKDGKDRKLHLVDKVSVTREETLLTFQAYKEVLPALKEYMLFFQKREPVVHYLHEKQEELLNSFFSFFVKPEVLVNCSDLTSVDLASEKHHLPSYPFLHTVGGEICQRLHKSLHKLWVVSTKENATQEYRIENMQCTGPSDQRHKNSSKAVPQNSICHHLGAIWGKGKLYERSRVVQHWPPSLLMCQWMSSGQQLTLNSTPTWQQRQSIFSAASMAPSFRVLSASWGT